jgi:curved DNA-binding protein CbpA
MMTYYEELGVPAGASRDEIRQAYKRLVRLLHPDRCGDPATRLLAELQMRRLNAVLQVLSNPHERANYNRSLLEGGTRLRRHATPLDWRARLRQLAMLPSMLPSAAAATGVLVLLLLCVLLPSSPPIPKPLAPAVAQARQLPLRRARRTPREPSSPADATEKTGASTEASPHFPVTGDPPAEVGPPENPEQAAVRTQPAGSGDSLPGESPYALTGEWLFVPTSETRNRGYPPEYIELRLSENEGVIHGRYRARYRVTDRAISPNVAFQFEGRTAAEGGVLPWRGPGGAQGEISLRLLANGSLEVEWAAGQLGEELGLISGAATLVRKLE